MSSKSRSKAKPRLSMAMDVDPSTVELGSEPKPEPPASPAADPADSALQADRPQPRSIARTVERPLRSGASARRRTTGASLREEPELPAELVGDPAVQVINGRVYVQVGEDLMPEAARVQMTIALTAMERHRWLRYAEENNLTLIEVLRRAMDALLG